MRWLLPAVLIGACVPEAEYPRTQLPFYVPAEVIFANEMGASFELRRVTMSIDGQPFGSGMVGKLGVATLQGGEHDVVVEAEYQGNGYGIFSYLKKYRFKARLAYRLEIPDARPRTIRCVGYEKGGATTPLEERPQIRCETNAT